VRIIPAIVGGVIGFLVGLSVTLLIWLGSFVQNLPWWVAIILDVFDYWLLGQLTLTLWTTLIILLVPTVVGAIVGWMLGRDGGERG
jgi:hypothetical protein